MCLVHAKKQKMMADAQDGPGQDERAQLSFDLVSARMGTAGVGGGRGSRSEKPAWALEAKDKALGATTKSRRLSRERGVLFIPQSQLPIYR